MRVPLLALAREHAEIRGEVEALWNETLEGMHLLGGPQTAAFEREMAEFCGVPHGVGVASGTDALALSLRAVGVSPGDEVILGANGFIAGVEAIRLVGAVPVLVDAEPEGYGLDIAAAERAISTRTRALLAVHLYGEPVALEPLLFLAREREFRVVEDCSHGHGARRQGRHVGSFGDVGAVSCGVVKNLGAYGDAGIVITGDAEVAQRVRRLRVHGQTTRSNHVEYGTNSRLDELQAAVLRVKLRRLEARNARRRTIARYYRTELRGQPIQLPEERPEQVPAFHQYVVQLSRRDAVRAWLAERGVETGVHYPVPLHRQPAWQGQYRPVGPFPRAEALADRILSLPISPDLTDAEVEFCAVAVRDALEACRVRGGAP